LEEEADVEGSGDGVGKGEEFACAGSAADAVRAVGGPVEEGEAAGVVGHGDEEAELALVEGGDGGPGVVGVHVEAE